MCRCAGEVVGGKGSGVVCEVCVRAGGVQERGEKYPDPTGGCWSQKEMNKTRTQVQAGKKCVRHV